MNGFTPIYSDNNVAAVCTEPGHKYVILKGTRAGQNLEKDPALLGSLSFQTGPAEDIGINGVSNQQVLAILIDRLEFQKHTFPSSFNKNALMHLNDALRLLIDHAGTPVVWKEIGMEVDEAAQVVTEQPAR